MLGRWGCSGLGVSKGSSFKYPYQGHKQPGHVTGTHVCSIWLQVLELGIALHSVLIGVALGVSQEPEAARPLAAALVFHQFFEGFALGGAVAEAGHEGWAAAFNAKQRSSDDTCAAAPPSSMVVDQCLQSRVSFPQIGVYRSEHLSMIIWCWRRWAFVSRAAVFAATTPTGTIVLCQHPSRSQRSPAALSPATVCCSLGIECSWHSGTCRHPLDRLRRRCGRAAAAAQLLGALPGGADREQRLQRCGCQALWLHSFLPHIDRNPLGCVLCMTPKVSCCMS